MPNLKLENRAVAFIDILGFKQLVERATEDSETSESIRFKWWWFKEFLNWEEKNNPFIIQNI